MTGRIRNQRLAARVVDAERAAELIESGDNVGMSGFTGAGYPKEVPGALAKRVSVAATEGKPMKVGLWTGASTAPELDGALAEVDGVDLRLPYQSDPTSRAKINSGEMHYTDIHLSHVAQQVWEGFLGPLDVAVVEVAGITEDGRLIPSSSVGNNKTWLEQADRIILEANSWQSADLEGMHDSVSGTALPPTRKPIPLTRPADRIGTPYLECPVDKVIAVVETHSPDRNTVFKEPDENSRIGRASCRERVEMPVGGGAVKKRRKQRARGKKRRKE